MTDKYPMISGPVFASHMTFGNVVSIDMKTGAITQMPGFTTTDAAALAFWEAIERLAPSRRDDIAKLRSDGMDYANKQYDGSAAQRLAFNHGIKYAIDILGKAVELAPNATTEELESGGGKPFAQLPTRHQVWKDGKWIDVCECGLPRDQCEHPVCTTGIINAARDANQ